MVSFKAAETIPPPAALAALGMTASSPAARVSACAAGRAFIPPLRGETRARRFKVRHSVLDEKPAAAPDASRRLRGNFDGS